MAKPAATTEEALLAAIYADPGDDAPRLVYADYLLERGDPRGELITLQCGHRDPERVRALLVEHKRAWLGSLTPILAGAESVGFARGFPVSASLLASTRAADVRALFEHPAWATLRRMTLASSTKPSRAKLIAHLARLGVEIRFARPRRSRDEVLAALKLAANGKRGTNSYLHGVRGIGSLVPGIDPQLVERAMRETLRLSPECCCELPDVYVPIAWRILGELTTLRATFVNAWPGDDDGERLRDACAWLAEATMVDAKPRNRQRLAALCANESVLAASRAAVAAHGARARQLVAILAHDGSDPSAAALRPVVERALASRDASVDALNQWFAPFARGSAMKALAAALAQATATRGAQSPMHARLAEFGARGEQLRLQLYISSRQVYRGFVRKVAACVTLDSHALPNAMVLIVRHALNATTTTWSDGVLGPDKLELGGPKSVDDLPRWLAASAKALRVTWDPATVRVTGSLRGKARAAAVAWLLTAPS